MPQRHGGRPTRERGATEKPGHKPTVEFQDTVMTMGLTPAQHSEHADAHSQQAIWACPQHQQRFGNALRHQHPMHVGTKQLVPPTVAKPRSRELHLLAHPFGQLHERSFQVEFIFLKRADTKTGLH